MARASQRMLKAGTPNEAPNRQRSSLEILSANYLDGTPSVRRTPPMPHGEASIATRRLEVTGGKDNQNLRVNPPWRLEKKAKSQERECAHLLT